MNSLSSPNTDEENLIQIIQQSKNTNKDALVHIGRKLDKLNNKRRNIVSREIILIMKWRLTIIM